MYLGGSLGFLMLHLSGALRSARARLAQCGRHCRGSAGESWLIWAQRLQEGQPVKGPLA